MSFTSALSGSASSTSPTTVDHRRDQSFYGDVWTWVALDAGTKLVPAFTLGQRSPAVAWAFVGDIAQRISGRAQITSDGKTMYLNAMDNSLAGQVDYAMLIKQYGDTGCGSIPPLQPG